MSLLTGIMEKARKRHTVTVNEENKLRVKKLLTEAVTLLCKNSITYGAELSIEGLLGITVDASDVYLVNINEKVKNDANPEPGYKTVEDNDAGYMKRWRDRLHSSHELLHNNDGSSASGTTSTVIDDHHAADDAIQIKTECVDEDDDVADMLTYEVTSKDVVSASDVSRHSGLASTASASCTFDNDIDFNASSSSLHCTDRYSSRAVADAPEPVSCANQENTASTDTTETVLLDTNNFPEGGLSTVESASTSTNEQHVQPPLADTSFCKPNLVKSLPPLLSLSTANHFQLAHDTSDTWSEQKNIEADFVVLDADTSQYFDGPAACPMISSGDKGLHVETLSGHTTSARTGLCSDEKNQTFASASQTHRRIAAYTYCPMACKVCGRVLRNRTIYMRHVKTHMGCMYSCHVCSRKFNRKDSLKRHYLMLHKYDMWPSNAAEQCVT